MDNSIELHKDALLNGSNKLDHKNKQIEIIKSDSLLATARPNIKRNNLANSFIERLTPIKFSERQNSSSIYSKFKPKKSGYKKTKSRNNKIMKTNTYKS